MLSTKEIGIVYETLLLSPGMNESVKLSVSLSRKNVLLLTKAIRLGLADKDKEDTLLAMADKDALEELSTFSDELLSKAGLQEMSNKLAALSAGK